MKTNKMLSDSSISKVWENFRKMKGVIVSLPAADWVATGDGTFTNTVEYDGFTSDEILEIDLYNDSNLTETHISEYDEYITEFDITDGALVAIATTKPTVDIDIICRGAIVGEKVIVNGGGSIKIRKMKQADYDKLPLEEQKSGHYIITDAPGLTAKTLEYDDSETQFGVNNVQDAIVEQNKRKSSYQVLHNPNDTSVSSIEKIVTTYNNRKFSDYYLITFVLQVKGWVRNSVTVPISQFKEINGVSVYYTDAEDVTRFIDVSYVSETSYKVRSSDNFDDIVPYFSVLGHTLEL